MPAAEIRALIDLGAVRVNNEVLLTDQALAPRDFMQAYLTPKRYTPRTRDRHVTQWQWLVASTRHFCVMDKPPGLPSVPSKDNRCVLRCDMCQVLTSSTAASVSSVT